MPNGAAGAARDAGANPLADALGDGARHVLLRAGQHDHELVAAVAGDLVVRARLGAQRVGDAAQQRVARRVAELVVDPLEVVEVDQHAAERLAVAVGARDLLSHAHLHRAVVEQAGERVGAGGGADVVVGLGVVAGDDGEVRDRLEHVEVVARDLALLHEADRERAAQLAVPAHRHADAGLHAAEHDAGRERELGVRGGHHRPARGEHPAGDALALGEAVAEPLVRAVVPGGREPAAVDVDEVDAGHVSADREAGLARERLEHGLQLERDVERVRGAGERAVALGLGDAAALGIQPGEPERRQVGERLGDQRLVRGPDVRRAAGEHGDAADVAAPGERYEQGAARVHLGNELGAQVGERRRLVERERARRRGDVRRSGRCGGGRDQLEGVELQRAACLLRERGGQLGVGARGQGRLGEAAQRLVRGVRAGPGCRAQ